MTVETAKLQRCETCRGTKQVMRIGGIVKKCDACSGVGWIKEGVKLSESQGKRFDAQAEVKTDDVKNVNGQPVVVKKKMGRPKRINVEAS